MAKSLLFVEFRYLSRVGIYATNFQLFSATQFATVSKPVDVMLDSSIPFRNERINGDSISDRAKEKKGYHPTWLKSMRIGVAEFLSAP